MVSPFLSHFRPLVLQQLWFELSFVVVETVSIVLMRHHSAYSAAKKLLIGSKPSFILLLSLEAQFIRTPISSRLLQLFWIECGTGETRLSSVKQKSIQKLSINCVGRSIQYPSDIIGLLLSPRKSHGAAHALCSRIGRYCNK
ncbi:hypothetical protein F0562_032475 [Nyssa sinensis]|uniref:Uncharacterized protein n=1 Tax=Nyssa sinensis TaxID=561372 RepID=A0A5J5ARQ6_9ASTE|nr:hypothetical protein F0562_032475 [Nyssa sinensis]